MSRLRQHAQGGYVLALNIAVLALLLVAATFVGQSVSEAVSLAKHHQDAVQDEVALESARSQALFLFATAPRSVKGLGDGSQTLALDGREYAAGNGIVVSFQDVRGLVSLNGPSLTSPSTGRIERFLGTYGLDGAKSTGLAEALLDYRDEDSLRRLNGAEEPDYRQAGAANLIRNKDLLSPNEVTRVLGWRSTAALWGADAVTDHLSTQRGLAFNPNVAGWRALVAVAELDEKTARELVDRRKRGEADDISRLAFAGELGDPFGPYAFVMTYPSASAVVVLRTYRAQWGYKLTLHHTPIEATSPWRVESVQRVNLPLPDKAYADYPALPTLKALKSDRSASPLKLPF